MANSDKDIKITPNTGESASPKIEVTGADNATKTITINDDGTISFDSTIAATSGSVANGNANLVTGDAVFDYIAAQGYTTNTGDITGVDLTGGTGVTIGSETGTTSGNYSSTISIGQAVGTGDSVTFANVTIADDIIHSGDTNNLISFGTDTQSFETGGTARMNISDSGLQIGSGARVTTINTSFSDNNTSLMTSAAIDDRIQSFGYTTNTGDITGVDLTGGTGVTIGSETNTGSGAYSSTISIGQAVGTSDDVTFSTLTLASDLIHSGDTNNKIAFGTDTQSFQTGGTARFNISDSGLQIGSGARVTEIEDNDSLGTSDTKLATQGNIKAYVDANAGGSPGGSDTFIQYNNGGSFGATTLAFDDTAGSEQILLDDTSDVALMKVVQRGTGSSFEVHDQASDSTVFQVSASGATSIGLGAGSGTGSDILFVQGRSSSQIWTASTDGSASAPVFTRRTDLDTGMYFIGADNIGLTTGGTLRVDISDSGLKLGSSGARVTTINTGFSDNDTSLMTSAAINDRIESFGYITSQMTFILEDDDGTEVSISNAEEVKFHSSDTSIDINYTDITPGSDADPFDLSFKTLHAPYLKTSDDRDFAPEDLANDIREISGRFSTKTGLEDGSTTNASDYVDVLVLDTFTGHTGGDANLLAFAKNSTKRIYHYRADQDDTNWGTASTIAYTSDITELANDANNRVVTATGSGGINGEANLTFDGSTLALAGVQTITAADTVDEAFKVTITDSDGTADSTPFIVDGDGRVGIGTASPVSGMSLTLNGDGSAYEGIAFQVGGSTKYKLTTDSTSVYYDSAINTGNQNFRVKDSGGNLRPVLGLEGSGFRVAVGYNGTSGSSLNPKNTFQVNVGTENGVQDNDDGILLLNSDLSIADGDMIGGIGFDTRDGNIPSVTTEAAAAIVAYAAEDHSTGDKGGHLAFLTSAIDDDDDTASTERMRITSEGKVIIGDTPNFTSQHDSTSKFTIQGTDAGMLIEKHDDSASGGPTLSLYRYSASEADGDLIGQVNFRGEGSTGNPSTYISVRTEIEDTTEGTKDGALIIRGLVNNSQTNMAEFHAAGLTLSQGSYNIGNVSKDANTVSGSSLADGSSVTLFTVPATTRGFKATIFFKDTSNTEYQIEEIMGYNTGSGVDFTSFGQVYSGSAAIGSLDASNSSGTTLIKFTNAQGSAINYQASISVTHMDLS